jgi:hypothetical protein
MWYWLIALAVGFLPLELYAAAATPGKADTFSEFIWWAFGVRPRLKWVKTYEHVTDLYNTPQDRMEWVTRRQAVPVKYPRFRRFILAGMCVSLTMHFVFAMSVVPVILFGIPVGIILIRAVGWERA